MELSPEMSGVGTRWSLRYLPTQAVLRPFEVTHSLYITDFSVTIIKNSLAIVSGTCKTLSPYIDFYIYAFLFFKTHVFGEALWHWLRLCLCSAPYGPLNSPETFWCLRKRLKWNITTVFPLSFSLFLPRMICQVFKWKVHSDTFIFVFFKRHLQSDCE